MTFQDPAVQHNSNFPYIIQVYYFGEKEKKKVTPLIFVRKHSIHLKVMVAVDL